MDKKNTYRTTGRTKILSYMKNNEGRSFSIAEIADYLENEQYSVNVTTIYRYMDKLVKEGQVNKFSSENGTKAVYQYVGEPRHCDTHLHLQCVKCGAVYHLDCSFMKEISEHIREDHGFELICKKSILYGVCNKCSKKVEQIK